jgi:diguanylate cyclase (GGDEF)-like protein/PAS domain S-box-containing protein
LSVSLVRDEAGKPLYFVSQIQDITERKLTEDALRISEEAYRTTFELAGVGMAHTDLSNGRFLRVNRKLCEITGYSAYELLCMSFYQITHPDDLAVNQRGAKRMSHGEVDEYATEKRYIRKDGRVVWVSLTASILRSLEGRPLYAVAMLKDITDGKRAEWLERDRREVLELVAQDRPIGDVLDRLTGLIERQTEASAAVLSLDGGQITLHAQNLPETFAQAVRQRPIRLAAALTDGASAGRHGIGVTDMSADPVWGELRPSCIAHGLKVCWAIPVRGSEQTTLGVLAVFCRENREPAETDAQMLQMAGKLATISIEHHQTTRQLAHLVRHDPLTGLPNRILFADRLEQSLAAARRSGKNVALLVLDLDRFKSINDTFGHQAGDALLQLFAHRVRSLVRDTDTLARVGGDEFLLLLPELEFPEGAQHVAAAIVAALAEPFSVAGQHLRVTSSVGIALCPRDGKESAVLQAVADAAMYRAKGQGRNQFAMGNPTSGVE